MGDRYRDIKGSSRPTRDDSRRPKERRRRHSRTRSRSPQRNESTADLRSSPLQDKKGRYKNEDFTVTRNPPRDEWEESDEEVPVPPPPPRITKISIGFTKPKAPIKMSIGSSSKPPVSKPTVASVFNTDEDDDEPEEMPAEARMRMRNIGRETPTSAGPNSFGKTKQGFCDAKKLFEKNLKEALETAEKPAGKLPQTIYKIKGP